MADDEDERATLARGFADVVGRRAGREALVDLGFAETECGCGFARPQQRARQHGIRLHALLAQRLAERTRLLAAVRRQRPQLIRRSGRGLGMTHDQQLHRARIIRQ